LFIGFGLALSFAQNEEITWYRNFVLNLLLHSPTVKLHPTDVSAMEKGAWNVHHINGRNVPVLFLKKYSENRPALNWLQLESNPNTIVYFHGGSYSCNCYYEELISIRNHLNVNIIAIEYPGFGDRPEWTTESRLLHVYPREVHEILNNRLKINWQDTLVWMNCFGGAVYLKCLEFMLQYSSHMPVAIFYSKPWVSIRRTSKTFIKSDFITKLTPMNCFSFLESNFDTKSETSLLSQVTCPVLMLVCEKDNITPPEYSMQLLERFVNAKYKKFKLLKDTPHGINMEQVVHFQLND
jgi:pimeloyl-ACP methyl ester carboxylesterase